MIFISNFNVLEQHDKKKRKNVSPELEKAFSFGGHTQVQMNSKTNELISLLCSTYLQCSIDNLNNGSIASIVLLTEESALLPILRKRKKMRTVDSNPPKERNVQHLF